MFNPLFRKLVENTTFGELDEQVETFNSKSNNEKQTQRKEHDTDNKYMIIRKGKMVGWGRI